MTRESVVDAWVARLAAGDAEAAWDLFVERYRRLVFAAIRHYATDYDDVMDVFAHVCQALRADDLGRLRGWVAQPVHRARFSTWLVAVVRNLTIDWFRQRDGRRRASAVADALPPLRRRIFDLVFLERRSHIEAYELLHSSAAASLSFRDFLKELTATYRAVTDGRKGQLLRELGGGPPPEAAEVELVDVAELHESRSALEAALGALPAEDRVAVELYIVEELPAEDVARIVGLPNAKAVYNRVYRALGGMRERLGRAGLGPGDG